MPALINHCKSLNSNVCERLPRAGQYGVKEGQAGACPFRRFCLPPCDNNRAGVSSSIAQTVCTDAG